MAPSPERWTMLDMLSSTVIEVRIELEAVTPDPFIADLAAPAPASHARVADLVQRIAANPPRRIYD